MSHHTATHLLNSALNSLLHVTAQRGSSVTAHHLRFNFAVFNIKFEAEMVEKIEKNIQDKIKEAIPVKLTSQRSSCMEAISNLITLPGELYPAQVRLVDIGDHVEPCCGTHLLNTEDLEDFVIVELKTPSPGVRSVKCLTGAKASQARRAAEVMAEEVEDLRQRIHMQQEFDILAGRIADLQSRMSSQDLPFVIREHLKSQLVKLQQTVRTSLRAETKVRAQDLISSSLAAQQDAPYFCHYIHAQADKFSLSSALKSVPANKPAILLARVGNEVKGKAVIPESLTSEGFSAKIWLDIARTKLGGKTSAPRGQSDLVNCNLMGGRVVTQETLDNILTELNKFATQILCVERDNE